MKPVVAIVGRPNVGKSTFFNRVTRTQDALVDDLPGVTRDRHFGDAEWNQTTFTLVDTGGFLEDDDDPFAGQIQFQVRQAIADADAVVLLMDGKSGISPFDREMISLLRRETKPVFYAVNKIDGIEQEVQAFDFYGLGLEKVYPVSAAHRYGIPDLLDELVAGLPVAGADSETDLIHVAVVGRPNVGKSSLVNAILGNQRLLVSNVPGTTRDAIDTMYETGGRSYLFIDTAGIRRKGRVTRKIEKFSVIKALKSLDRCDVALILIDAVEGVTDQDISVAGYAMERGCGCIFLLNKWDALEEKDSNTASRFIEQVKHAAKFLGFAPVLTISAKTGLRVRKIFPLVDEIFDQYQRRIGTGVVNRIVNSAVEVTAPPLHKGKRLKFYYATQVGTRPPTFVIFVNFPDAVHFSYRRFLTNRIREGTGLDKIPIRIFFRLRTGKIEFGDRKSKKKNIRDARSKKRKKAR